MTIKHFAIFPNWDPKHNPLYDWQGHQERLEAERRKQLLERTRAKEQRNASSLATLAEVGPTDPMDSLPLIALTGIQPGQDIGGGVWDYLFPDEQQHGVTCPPADVPDREIRCMGSLQNQGKGASWSRRRLLPGRLVGSLN